MLADLNRASARPPPGCHPAPGSEVSLFLWLICAHTRRSPRAASPLRRHLSARVIEQRIMCSRRPALSCGSQCYRRRGQRFLLQRLVTGGTSRHINPGFNSLLRWGRERAPPEDEGSTVRDATSCSSLFRASVFPPRRDKVFALSFVPVAFLWNLTA